MKQNARNLLAVFILALFSTAGSLFAAEPSTDSIGPAIENPALTADNLILVTFINETSNRVPVASISNNYRSRGDYQNTTWSKRVAEQLADQYRLKPIRQWPILALDVHCVIYDITGHPDKGQLLEQLKSDERVESVQMMKQFHGLAETYNDPYYTLQSDMRSMRIGSAHHFSTGRHVKIAVIDTGIDQSHADLAGQIALSENYVAETATASKDIHGTAVAGIIAAIANNGKGIVGVAPRASLLSLKACWQAQTQRVDSNCNSFTLARAIDRAISLQADIINLSLTGPQDPLVERLLDKAIDHGIIIVASVPTQAAPDNGFPASMNRVIGVRTAEVTPPPEAGRLPPAAGATPALPTIAAPGMEILTTMPNDTYNFISGSSFATAHVSGLIALLIEVNPKLALPEIKRALQNAMQTDRNVQTLDIIDACNAIASINLSCICPTADI